jgi:hypothetical protein
MSLRADLLAFSSACGRRRRSTNCPDGVQRVDVTSARQSLTPNSSALIVVLNDRRVNDVQRDLDQAHARVVIANQIAAPEGTN